MTKNYCKGITQLIIKWYDGVMKKYTLTDTQWAAIEHLCQGKKADPGRTASDNRLFIEAVLWIIRTGHSWRHLPQEYGNWNSIFQRYRRWVKGDVFTRIFEELNRDPDCDYILTDGISIRYRHQEGLRKSLRIRPLPESQPS